jgi:hypothetical protein
MDFTELADDGSVEWLKRRFAAGRLNHVSRVLRIVSVRGAFMIYRGGRVLAVVVTTFIIGCAAVSAGAKDYFLTIGGGPDPSSNQLSLERNVVVQQSILAQQRPDHPDIEIWFADGNDQSRDLQCRDPELEKSLPPARRLLAELLGDADSVDLVYRNHDIKGLNGPAELKVVIQRFESLANEVKSGDRVIVYTTGHGGRPKRPERGRRRAGANAYNTVLYFWNTETISASEFADWLDRFPKDVQVVLIMVQCYAGGFSHTIFNHADAKQGLSPYERCGFFAQLHDRAAAGCTPDADEADFEEYSGCFWGALAGKSRDGKVINSADYDKNGRVSFAEANAYSVIESDTIDVPVRTTEALLRQYSRTGNLDGDSTAADGNGSATSENTAELTKMDGPVSKLLTTCRPDQRAILEQLPEKCELGAEPTIEGIQQKLEQHKNILDGEEAKLASATKTRRVELKKLKDEILKQWPELKATYSAVSFELAGERGPEFVREVQAMANFESWHEAKTKEKELAKAVLRSERQKARLERLLRTCEDAVLAENLSRVAAPEVVKRYQELLAMEEGTLADSSRVSASGN